jgi:predicted nucleic acid-binding protein
MGTLIDTSVFVAFERGELAGDTWPSGEEEEVALSVVTASELLHGVERGAPSLRRAKREAYVNRILSLLPIIPIDLEIARIHARLTADLAVKKLPIGAHDAWIAATALVLGYSVATRNLREFERVDGLRVQRW